MSLKLYCDKCGKEIKTQTGYHVNFGCIYHNGTIVKGEDDEGLDLCTSCLRDVVQYAQTPTLTDKEEHTLIGRAESWYEPVEDVYYVKFEDETIRLDHATMIFFKKVLRDDTFFKELLL